MNLPFAIERLPDVRRRQPKSLSAQASYICRLCHYAAALKTILGRSPVPSAELRPVSSHRQERAYRQTIEPQLSHRKFQRHRISASPTCKTTSLLPSRAHLRFRSAGLKGELPQVGRRLNNSPKRRVGREAYKICVQIAEFAGPVPSTGAFSNSLVACPAPASGGRLEANAG